MNKFRRLLGNQGMVVLSKPGFTWSKLSALLSNTTLGSFGISTSTNIQCLSATDQKKTQLTPYNPISELQPFVAVPIIPEGTASFNPAESEIKFASKFFTPKDESYKIKHIKTAAEIDKLPKYDIPEVAFIGRSNVGKSSLIHTLFSKAPITVLRKLSVSSKPGRTKALQLYQAGGAFTLVDMPGYGHNMPSYFVNCVETYFQKRTNLKVVFILIDSEIGLTRLDKDMLEKLHGFSTVHCLVLTKIDKVNRHQLVRNLMSVMNYRDEHSRFCLPQPFLVSAHSGAGIELLQTFIAYVTGNMLVTGS
ncbi:GTP-binding protein 8-like isoform X2 [Mizuhopecten yessoensis]|uniref:GTP-binding protein 8-like isoform X2 n=1 Tax=Mizuhopecten yessoensis TaxID=6573 RepID=UPI000B45D169|nr:GTP-binding protein 8-like isoform X2 [Mizuhopecten yessoensis]